MELKTKHKRLLAIIFALEPFSSSVALAMEGGALNEELVHSEVFNKKDSTTYIVPGQDELGNKTNEVTLESNLDDNRLVVQKIDRNGSRLEGAKFGLYNSAEELVREDITNSQGRIDFGKLEKGLYSLKELEAPKGYVLSNDTYIIEVKEDGSLTWSIYRTKAQGRDLNNSIQVKGYNLENNRENIKLFADLLIEEKVQAGDFFTISLDSKLQNPKVANLYTESGLLLAEAKYDQETKTVKYVFTKIAEYESLLNFQISIEEMQMNTEEVLATNNNEFITIIGDKVEEPVLLDDSEEVKIEEGLEANFLNISSQITGMDWENHTVEYTVSLNPNKNLINKGTSLEISNNSTSVLLNQLDTSIEIFRQDELTGQLVNITSKFNTNNFTADENILESFALDFDENQLNGYNYSYHNPYSYYDNTTRNYKNVENHGFPTLQLSQNVKNLDTEVFNIGIAVTGDTEVSNTTAKTLMANISSGAGYNYDLTNADKLPDAFNSIINSVYRDTISKGIVTDPMGEKVDLVVDETFNSNDYTISATRNGVNAPDLLIGVTPKYDPTTRTITLEGLNLGLGEEVIFKYKVALRVDDETVQDNVYYFTNGETTLQPNPSAGKVLWNFPVPSVKKIGEEPP